MARANPMRPERAFLRPALTPAALPAGLAFAVFVLLAAKDAGHATTAWYPATLFLLGLTAVWWWARRPQLTRLPTPALASVAFLAALTAWTYVSIAWSDVKGDAWDGANRGLLYLVVYALFAVLVVRAEAVALLLAAYVLAVTALGIVELVAASRAADPDAYFLVARFAEPTGYQNANCALFSIAFWPALVLASRRQVPLVVRALMLGSAAMLVELALLSQSRGWLVAMPIVFALAVAVVPGRVRLLLFTLPVALAVVAARGPLLDVFPALQSGEDIRGALRDARTATLLSGAALVLVGAAAAAADRVLASREALTRRAARVLGALFALAAVGVAVAALVWIGNPVTRVENAWADFKGKPPPIPTKSYFTSGFGSNRYDIWRVAVKEIEDAPLVGVGSDNFAVDYLRERRSDEEPLYPHSLELKIVTQTGIVGAVLFLGFLGAAVVAWARRRDEPEAARALRAGALVGFAYWLVHGSVDWFWELPGLAAPAFAMLGLAVAPAAEPIATAVSAGHTRLARATFVSVVVLVAAASLVLPWLAAKEVRAAAGEWRREPESAFDRLDRARRLNPLSDQPDLIGGAIAARLGDTPRVVAAFTRALDRNPKNWYARLELGVAYANLGRRADALRELAVARRLNPREPTIRLAQTGVRRGRPISLAELDRIFLRRNVVSNRKNR